MRKWYKKWKTQKGEAITVSPLEFVEYYKVNNTYHQWEEGDVLYEGQIWKCRLSNREIKYLPFRVKVDPLDKDSYSKNTSLVINRNPIKEKVPNPITDTWEEVTLNVISKDLFPSLENLSVYLKALTELEEETKGTEVHDVIKYRLNLQNCDTRYELDLAYNNYLSVDRELKLECRNLVNFKLDEILHRK